MALVKMSLTPLHQENLPDSGYGCTHEYDLLQNQQREKEHGVVKSRRNLV